MIDTADMEMTLQAARETLAPLECFVYCIGAQKSGTTWLHDQMAKRSDVAFSRKEFHYWSSIGVPGSYVAGLPVRPIMRWLRKQADARWMRWVSGLHPKLRQFALTTQAIASHREDHRAYAKAVMQFAQGARVSGDFTPEYALLRSHSFARMAALHDNARFIFMMRDPVDRMWSSAKHAVRMSQSGAYDPALAVRKFEEAIGEPLDMIFALSRYDRTIAELERAVPQDRILYLFFEDLFTDAAARKIGAFLALDNLRLDTAEVVHRGASDHVRPAPAVLARAADALAPVYEAVEERFGRDIPETWGRYRTAPAAWTRGRLITGVGG